MKKLCMLLFVICCTICANAQVAQFQALYIYNFAKNIGWPAEDINKDFVINVIGDNAVANELTKLAGSKLIGGRKVVVIEPSTVSGLVKSDIIYIGEAKSSYISQLCENQKNNKTLLISGKPGMCGYGMGISFKEVGGKLKFEISSKNISRHSLQVSSKLMTLGIQVD